MILQHLPTNHATSYIPNSVIFSNVFSTDDQILNLPKDTGVKYTFSGTLSESFEIG